VNVTLCNGPRTKRDARRKRLCQAALNGETVGVEQEVADRYTVALEVIRGLGSAEEITLPDLPIAAVALPAIDSMRAPRTRRKAIAVMDSLLAPFAAAIAPGRSAVAPSLDPGLQEEPKDWRVRTIGRAANLCGLLDVALSTGSGR